MRTVERDAHRAELDVPNAISCTSGTAVDARRWEHSIRRFACNISEIIAAKVQNSTFFHTSLSTFLPR